MRDSSTGSERATGDASTPPEERAFGEAGSSFEAQARLRQSATARMRTYRRNKRMGLGVRPVRLSRKQAHKFTIAMEAVGNPEKKGVTLAKARGE